MASSLQFDFDVFLSHNRADKDWVRMLAARIEHEKWNDRALKVFFDEWDIPPGGNIPITLERALAKSRKVALVMSPEYFNSEWTEFERVSAAYISPANRSDRIVPLLLRQCDRPPLVAALNYIDFRDTAIFETGFKRLLAFLREEPLPRGVAGNVHIANPPIPRSPVTGFIARRDKEGYDLVEYVGKLLMERNAFVLLWGEGGIGKTALAAEIARNRECVVWASADGRAEFSLDTLIDEIVTQLEHADYRTLKPEKKLDQARYLLADAKALLVIDNFETIAEAEQARIADFVLSTPVTSLVTSRRILPRARNIEIDAMVEEEAREFATTLVQISPRHQMFAGINISQIITVGAANPLIMEWIVAQIEQAREPHRVFDDLIHGKGDAAQRVFDRSFNLEYLGHGGRATLLALTLFVPHASREALALVSGLDANACDDAVTRLVSLRLAETTALNARIGLVGLTRELARTRLSQEEHNSEAVARFVDYFIRFAEANSKGTLDELGALEGERENLLATMNMAFALNDWSGVRRIANVIVGSTQLGRNKQWGDVIAIAKEMEVAADNEQRPKHVRITLTRTNDHDEDVMRMRELFRLLTSTQGRDRFTFFVPNPNGVVQLDFPQYTTSYRVIEDLLARMISEWGTMEVRPVSKISN